MLIFGYPGRMAGSASRLTDGDFRQLATFRAVAAERSFGRAALSLGYTQSAVSQQIAALERHVGGSLFDRPGGPKPVELTPLGHLFLDHAEALLQRLEAARAEIGAFQQGLAGSLALGTFQSVSVRVLPALAKRFRTEHPGIELRLHESDDLDGLFDLLRSGELELSFVVAEAAVEGVEMLPLLEDTYIVLCPPDDTVSPGTASVDVRELSGLPMVSEFDSACQRLIHEGMRDAGVDFNVVFRSNDNSAIAAMVAAGIGHSVMPALAVRVQDPGVTARPMEPGIPARSIALAWRTGHTLSPAASAFMDLARAVTAEMARSEPYLNPAPPARNPAPQRRRAAHN